MGALDAGYLYDPSLDRPAPIPQASAELEQPKAKKKRGVRVASRGDISGLSSEASVASHELSISTSSGPAGPTIRSVAP